MPSVTHDSDSGKITCVHVLDYVMQCNETDICMQRIKRFYLTQQKLNKFKVIAKIAFI